MDPEEAIVNATIAEDRDLINELLRQSPEADKGIKSKHVFLMILTAFVAGCAKILDELHQYESMYDTGLVTSFVSKQVTSDVLNKIIVPYYKITYLLDHVLEVAIPEIIKTKNLDLTKFLLLRYKEKTGNSFSDPCILEGGRDIINYATEELGFHVMRVHAIISGNVEAYKYLRSLQEPSSGCIVGELFLALRIGSPCISEMGEDKARKLIQQILEN